MTNQPSVRPLPEFCPPTELIRNWETMYQQAGNNPDAVLRNVAWETAQWGADLELEACCSEVSFYEGKDLAVKLRQNRRPKPLSLKEQALAVLNDYFDLFDGADQNIIRRALEELPND
mgnify:CR=1 FL=1|tara:strand:+ start:1932 stop:2285 length:354 start_codon:yes stop_codon:yes gene_type:complete